MDFLRKTPQLRWPTAGLIVFLAGYLGAAVSTLFFAGMAGRILASFGLVIVTVVIYMTIVYIISRLLDRTDVVDAAWGGAFVVAWAASFALNPNGVTLDWNIQTLVGLLVVAWALRLSYSIIRRLLRYPEDARYIKLRRQWKGSEVLNTYVRIFLVQALLASCIALAIIHANLATPEPLGVFAWLGALMWLIGFMFEAVGDWQLRRFLAQPKNKGKLMTSGLWKYTRHPNYFGEATMWWGIFVIVLDTTYGWVGVITPVLITYLLLFVSGVPMTEQSFEKKPGWKTYQKRTSAFFPLPPKQ